jgi:hypothetical protein
MRCQGSHHIDPRHSRRHDLSLSSLLQEDFVEGHTTLYWASCTHSVIGSPLACHSSLPRIRLMRTRTMIVVHLFLSYRIFLRHGPTLVFSLKSLWHPPIIPRLHLSMTGEPFNQSAALFCQWRYQGSVTTCVPFVSSNSRRPEYDRIEGRWLRGVPSIFPHTKRTSIGMINLVAEVL